MFSLEKIPLRERQRARTRLAFVDAAWEMTRTKRFADITVKDLCQRVEVSEKTFFNYFSVKSDLILYAIQLWSIEVVWHAQEATDGRWGLDFIERVFEYSAGVMADHPRIMLDIIAWHASEPELAEKEIAPVGLAERRLRFPGLEGIEDIPHRNILIILTESFQAAISSGEIPSSTNVEDAVAAASSIFFGTPMLLAVKDRNGAMAETYRRYLHRLWREMKRPGWSDPVDI